MKIAVTYDNGNIFQHFGKTENFKVYEVEDNQVVSSEVIGSNGTGHGALAGLLSEQGVDVLICGGIGGGAQAALAEAGVELCSGAEGDVDAAVSLRIFFTTPRSLSVPIWGFARRIVCAGAPKQVNCSIT